MRVTEKGQVTIPKHIRDAVGVLPGSEVTFAIEAGKIVISKLASGLTGHPDRKSRENVSGEISVSSCCT